MARLRARCAVGFVTAMRFIFSTGDVLIGGDKADVGLHVPTARVFEASESFRQLRFCRPSLTVTTADGGLEGYESLGVANGRETSNAKKTANGLLWRTEAGGTEAVARG